MGVSVSLCDDHPCKFPHGVQIRLKIGYNYNIIKIYIYLEDKDNKQKSPANKRGSIAYTMGELLTSIFEHGIIKVYIISL